MEIVSKSESQVILAGESTTLSCESSEKWQFCYWENEATGDKHRTAQKAVPGAFPATDRITFDLNETKCAISITLAEPEDGGDWKCHLADTDKDEGLVGEDFVHLDVASEASIAFDPILGEDNEAKVGEFVDLKCAVEDAAIFPPPTVRWCSGRCAGRSSSKRGWRWVWWRKTRR